MRGRTPNNETGHIEWENTSVQRGLFFTFRLFPLIRPGLRPVHLPRRGRRPPGGGFIHRGLFFVSGVPSTPAACGRHPLQAGEGGGCLRRGRGGTRSVLRTAPHPSGPLALPPSPRRGFFYAIYASRSESFLTIREVMRNSTATKARKPHWALVVSEVAMKS